MKEKGIKAEDVKNLPPIEEIHGLDNPTQVVEENSLYRFDKCEIPFTKFASPCLDEFDDHRKSKISQGFKELKIDTSHSSQ